MGADRYRSRSNGASRSTRHESGAVAIMFSVIFVMLLTFIGLALDLSRVYNRRAELQALADVAALSAARKLNGSSDGMDAASDAAKTALTEQKYNYNAKEITWSASALTFGATPHGPWLDAGAAKNAPVGIRFARVDTAAFGDDVGKVEAFFLRTLSGTAEVANLRAESIAGRSTSKVTPLAVCALSTVAAGSRTIASELVQYGFRRGVGYNLMDLNYGASTPASFVINPIDPPGTIGSSSNTSPAVVGPFVCSGTIPSQGLLAGQVPVSRPFPLASLYEHLNSRFDQYSGGYCKFRSAPPDLNIKAFTTTGASWMTVAPGGQSASGLSQPANGSNPAKRLTVADPDPGPTGTTAQAYGVLWSFARPVSASAYVAGKYEPPTGYTPFNKSVWQTLYSPGNPAPKGSYPALPPYFATGGANFTAPSAAHGKLQLRRVLNIPLLACPVAPGANAQATVLAIGRFFMTVPATATTLNAEFAGIVSEDNLGGAVELYK